MSHTVSRGLFSIVSGFGLLSMDFDLMPAWNYVYGLPNKCTWILPVCVCAS